MELFEMVRQTISRQIFQHLGVELQHIPSRRDAWMPFPSRRDAWMPLKSGSGHVGLAFA
jgi:hypothetical protein